MNITVKSLPNEVGEALKRSAAASSRSLNREIIHRLTESLNVSSPDAVADAWAALGGGWNADVSVEEELARLYTSRSNGREIDLNW